jgi:oxygen-dependent protoporphyrinogen oxidase
LKSITGSFSDPEFLKIHRHQRAIPQYVVGHAARLERLAEAVKPFPGLVLSGNAYRGVSLNDCVVNAGRAAKEALKTF